MDGICVCGNPVHQVPHLAPAVKGERKPLKVGIEVPAHVIYHLLAYHDGCVVVKERNGAENDIDDHQADRRQGEQMQGRIDLFQPPRGGFAAEYVIYYDL